MSKLLLCLVAYYNFVCRVDEPIGSFSMSPFSGITDSYSDIPDSNKPYDYDSRPSNEGLDDSFRPSLDSK